MPYRKFSFRAGEYYHLFNRGNNFGDIFRNREDYLLFLRLLRKHLLSSGAVELAAYCLMPNHYHLLAKLQNDGLSSAMQSLSLAYTKCVNYKYGRVGSLFQGRFKAVHVDRQRYLDALMVYVHRNPVEAGLVAKAHDWEFSSFRDCLGQRKGTLVVRGLMNPAIHMDAVNDSRVRNPEGLASVILE
ncbi:MAG TPA: transposase [Anaerolineales bacterium]|nr:transposase [Anaerolineales bacterium]